MTHSRTDGQGGEGDAAAPEAAPAQVLEFAAALVEFVRRALGMTLDFGEETLPVVDHYLEQARLGKVAATRPAPGAADGSTVAVPPEILQLLAPAVGCYFGEVLRRKFGGHWILEGDEPGAWRLGLAPCFLHFHPVAMAACALVGEELEGVDDTFGTSERETAALSDALESAAPIDEQTYYSLAGRVDVLSHVADFLMGHAVERGTACRYPAAAYLNLPPRADTEADN